MVESVEKMSEEKMSEKSPKRMLTDLTLTEMNEVFERLKQGEKVEVLAKEFFVSEEELEQVSFVKKKSRNLTQEERKRRKGQIIKEMVQNKERVQQDKAGLFAELGQKYGMDPRSIRRVFDENEEAINEARTTTAADWQDKNFAELDIIKDFIHEKKLDVLDEICKEYSIARHVHYLKVVWENYHLAAGGDPRVHPTAWTDEGIRLFVRNVVEEDWHAVSHGYRSALNQLKKKVGDSYALRYRLMGAATKHCTHAGIRRNSPKGIVEKHPLTSAQIKQVLEAIPQVYDTSFDEIHKFFEVLGGRDDPSREEIENIFLDEAIRELGLDGMKRDFQNWKRGKRTRKGIEQLHLIDRELMGWFKRWKNVKQAVQLEAAMRIAFNRGSRSGSRARKIEDVVDYEKDDQGIRGMKWKNWTSDFSKFTIKEKRKLWKDKQVTEEVQNILKFLRCFLSKEEKSLESYCFPRSYRFGQDLIKLTELSKLGEYKRGWYVWEPHWIMQEVPENTEGAKYGIIFDKERRPIMLWGIHLFWHLLRASMATYLKREKNLPDEVIMEMGGWTTWDAFRRYVADAPDIEEKAIQAFSEDGF